MIVNDAAQSRKAARIWANKADERFILAQLLPETWTGPGQAD